MRKKVRRKRMSEKPRSSSKMRKELRQRMRKAVRKERKS
jgi:hypothetical protein